VNFKSGWVEIVSFLVPAVLRKHTLSFNSDNIIIIKNNIMSETKDKGEEVMIAQPASGDQEPMLQ
jgi:hypothetical protein